MKLYFRGSNGKERVIGSPIDETEALKTIDEFCEDRNFKIYYIRRWEEDDGRIKFDVGSHTEFFLLDIEKEK